MVERNPKYDGLYVFKPNLAELEPGDIILTRNAETTSFKGKAQSDAIARATGGNFSHALLCTTPPTLIEAIGDGVSNVSAQICFAHDLKNVRVLRYADRKIANAAGSAALKFLGQEYSVRSAIRSIVPGASVTEPDDAGTFCSALVSTAFRVAGAPEFSAIDPMKTTPATLEKSAHFVDVTSKAFLRILSPNNIEEMSALDGDRIPSPLFEQAKFFSSYYERLSPLIQQFMDRHPGFLNRKPRTFLECLAFLIDGFVAIEELQPGVRTDALRVDLKLIDEVAFSLLAQGEMARILNAAQLNDDKSNRYMLAESFRAKPDIDFNDVRGLILATRQQISSRSSVLNNSAAPAGKSRAWDEWLKLSETIIESLKNRAQEVRARVFPSMKIEDS